MIILTAFYETLLNDLNYYTLTILMALESSIFPVPSELVVPPAAYMAAETGEMNVGVLVLVATIGSNIGALINYVLA